MATTTRIKYCNRANSPGDSTEYLPGFIKQFEGAIHLVSSFGDIVESNLPHAALYISPQTEFQTALHNIKLEVTPGYFVEYDILFTTEKSKKTKKWLDGSLKYDEKENMGIFADESGKQILKKKLNNASVREGAIIDAANYFIEITCRRLNSSQADITGVLNGPSKRHKPSGPIQPAVQTPTQADSRSAGQVSVKREGYQQSVDGEKRTIVFTEDKHKKLKKKWLDGFLEWSPPVAKFYNQENHLIFSRNLSPNQVYTDAELESGRFQFVIGDIIGAPPQSLPSSIAKSARQLMPANKAFVPPKNIKIINDCRRESKKALQAGDVSAIVPEETGAAFESAASLAGKAQTKASLSVPVGAESSLFSSRPVNFEPLDPLDRAASSAIDFVPSFRSAGRLDNPGIDEFDDLLGQVENMNTSLFS